MTGDWMAQPPRSIVPRPAGSWADLRGQRVLVGQPGVGWRGDLRADTAVVQASRTYVPVLSEQEWYRAESEQIETFAALVPVERVWVETPGEVAASPGQEPKPDDLFSRLVSLDAPAVRRPVSARLVPALVGRRMVRTGADGEHRDLRAVTEPYQNADGDVCVRVSRELDWYRWGWTGQSPRTLEVPVYLLWLE